MSPATAVLQSLALAASLVASSSASAALTVYTSQASFLSAIAPAGVDTFSDLSITDATASPMARRAGSYTYVATSTTSFYGAGTPANPWLSTNAATDSITFSGFSGGVSAIGGLFFGSNVSGAFATGTIMLTATDSLGATLTQTLTNATVTSFLGFTSSGRVTSLVVTAVSPTSSVWPTVDNLTLSVVAVPEPQSVALMLGGLGLLGLLRRRLRA